MSMTEEERRRARAEASRRCRERKAAMAAAAGAKNRNKAKPAEKPKAEAKPAPKAADPLKAAEKVVKRFAKVAAGIKPMLRESADVLSAVYRTEDEKAAAKVERLLAKSLGVVVGRLPSDSFEKTRVCLDASSKTVKTPAFRLEKDGPAPSPAGDGQAPFDEDFDEESAGDVSKAGDDEESTSVEAVPVDPMSLAKIEAGEAAPGDEEEEDDLDVDELLEDEDGEEGDEDDEDEDEDDDEDEERRSRRRAREDADNERDWASGRWEMMGEMGAQGAFDD